MGDGGRNIFVLLGPMRERWPEPLGALVADSWVHIEAIRSVHEIAARLRGGDSRRGEVRGLLIDPAVLMKRDVAALRMMMRYVQLPMFLLPMTQGASPVAKEVGAMAWEVASGTIEALAVREDREEDEADNEMGAKARGPAGNPMSEEVMARYDEFGGGPIVSEAEIQALLGA